MAAIGNLDLDDNHTDVIIIEHHGTGTRRGNKPCSYMSLRGRTDQMVGNRQAFRYHIF